MTKSTNKLNKVYIANRGEIACRAIRPCREQGIKTVVGFSTADALSLAVRMADEAIHIGDSPASKSYLNIEKVVDAALKTGCDAVFPGYGFLAENADFAQAVEDAGLIFIGPQPHIIRKMGNKVEARRMFVECGVPVVPALESVKGAAEVKNFGEESGWPVIIKATHGGGGKGMKIVNEPGKVDAALESAKSVALKAFGDPSVFVEKYIEGGRHIEFQFLADEFENVVHLGERECSIQRQHQKLIEEAPSSLLTPEKRAEMGGIVTKAVLKMGYLNTGTMEFLMDKHGDYYALELNTRIQVEHTVTEMVTGFDIIRKMLKIAAGNKLSIRQDSIHFSRHAIQCRINAEDPKNDFAPSYGRITFLRQVSGPFVRTESGIYQGWVVPAFYDSMISKIVSVGKDRETAIQRMNRALMEYEIRGIKTTVPLHKRIMTHPDFVAGDIDTGFIERNLDTLLDYVDEDDPVMKIARFIADVSAKGGNYFAS